jgi:carboxypeptidase D
MMPSSSFLGLWMVTTTFLSFGLAVPSVPSESTNKRYTHRDDDIDYTVFEHAATGSNLTYVKDSGICETTPGVHQYSGTLSVGEAVITYIQDLILATS